jgi:hypothetical protein
MKICLTQQIASEASPHAVSEGFTRNFAFLLVENRNFRELAECRSSKRILAESDSVEICGPVMAVAVEGTIPGEHVGCSESKAK